MKTDIHSSLRPEPVLSCWKEIASYFRRDVRTVQRWERSRGLPVHRLPGKGKKAVYALIPELDAWWVSAPPAAEDTLVAPPRWLSHRQRVRAALLTGAAFTALAVTLWLLL